jgi:hypothetical protein
MVIRFLKALTTPFKAMANALGDQTVRLWRGVTNTPPHMFLTVGAVVLGILGAFIYVVAAQKDTTAEIVAINAALLVFSSVSFSASRAMDPNTEEMRQYRLAGEYFLQGSLWLLLLGIFRYAWWNELRERVDQLHPLVKIVVIAVLLFCLVLPFAVAAGGVSAGFVTLHNLMIRRLGTHPREPAALPPHASAEVNRVADADS